MLYIVLNQNQKLIFDKQSHTNAHSDNFIIILNGSNILAPLDLDLAFCKEEIINIDIDVHNLNSSESLENKNYGKFDLEQWLIYQDQERIGLEFCNRWNRYDNSKSYVCRKIKNQC